MKKFITVFVLACLMAAMSLSVFAEDLPSYTYDRTIGTWGKTDMAPFSYKFIVKETGTIGDMSYAGTDNFWNPGMEMFQTPTNEYAYCFAGNDCLHPATNADPAIAFTAPHSGTVLIKYVYYGATTTELQIYKNEYKSEKLIKSQTPNNETTDFELTVDVQTGDVLLFALDCGENNASDQTPCWINSVEYTNVVEDTQTEAPDTTGSNPNTGDIAIIGAVSLAVLSAAVMVAVKKKH